jgi:hypothetical protein
MSPRYMGGYLGSYFFIADLIHGEIIPVVDFG